MKYSMKSKEARWLQLKYYGQWMKLGSERSRGPGFEFYAMPDLLGEINGRGDYFT